MTKKYMISDEFVIFRGVRISRIVALMDFGSIKKGEFGGYVEHQYNLSQYGFCWIYDDSVVINKAIVRDSASISRGVVVRDRAVVKDDAVVIGDIEISGCAVISNKWKIHAIPP